MKFALALVALLTLGAWMPLESANETSVRVATESGKEFCSGTVIDHVNNYILTANHCVENVKTLVRERTDYPNGEHKIEVKVAYKPLRIIQIKHDDEGYEYARVSLLASVVKTDSVNDLAIVKINAPLKVFFKSAILSVAPVRYLDEVYHVGMPLGIGNTITVGIVSKPRIGKFPQGPFIPEDAIVFTAYINHGSSGGGLYNKAGELIGITNWGLPGGPYIASRVIHAIELMKGVK